MILLFGISGVFVLLTLPIFLGSLATLNRWWRLSGVLLYWLAACGAAEGFLELEQLNLNWQDGYDTMRGLDSFIAALNTGALLPVVICYDSLLSQQHLSFIFCEVGVCWNTMAALLAFNPYKKYTWLVFLIAPLWFGGSLFWCMKIDSLCESQMWRTIHFGSLKSEIEEARAKGIPDSSIAGNLGESRTLFRFSYENNRTGRESIYRTLAALKKLTDRVEARKCPDSEKEQGR